MIQVYDAFNDEYDRNGNVVLDPIECIATFSLDGNWSMHMELPITKNMSTLDDISVVAADTPYGKKQVPTVIFCATKQQIVRITPNCTRQN